MKFKKHFEGYTLLHFFFNLTIHYKREGVQTIKNYICHFKKTELCK